MAKKPKRTAGLEKKESLRVIAENYRKVHGKIDRLNADYTKERTQRRDRDLGIDDQLYYSEGM